MDFIEAGTRVPMNSGSNKCLSTCAGVITVRVRYLIVCLSRIREVILSMANHSLRISCLSTRFAVILKSFVLIHTLPRLSRIRG